MKNLRQEFRRPSEWAIIDEKIIHDYSPAERPIEVVNVLIGTLHYEVDGMDGALAKKRTPITRWITKNQYKRFVSAIELD